MQLNRCRQEGRVEAERETEVGVDFSRKHFIKCGSIGWSDGLECKMGPQFGDDHLRDYAAQQCERKTGGKKRKFKVRDDVL